MATSAPIGEPYPYGSAYPPHQYTYPPTCSHGMAWAVPCAACGRGYPAPVMTGTVDLSLVMAALDRIEDMLRRLLGGEGGEGEHRE